jgi:hypothetical protein
VAILDHRCWGVVGEEVSFVRRELRRGLGQVLLAVQEIETDPLVRVGHQHKIDIWMHLR